MVPHRTDLVITAGLLHVIVRFATCDILNTNQLLPCCIRNAFNDLHALYFEHYTYNMCFGMFCRLYTARGFRRPAIRADGRDLRILAPRGAALPHWRDRRCRYSLVLFSFEIVEFSGLSRISYFGCVECVVFYKCDAFWFASFYLSWFKPQTFITCG